MNDTLGKTRHPSNIKQPEHLATNCEKRDGNYESEADVSKTDKIRRNRCRNAEMAPEYHDHCALVVDRHDVRKVMVGLMAGRGWGRLACKPASLARFSSSCLSSKSDGEKSKVKLLQGSALSIRTRLTPPATQFLTCSC